MLSPSTCQASLSSCLLAAGVVDRSLTVAAAAGRRILAYHLLGQLDIDSGLERRNRSQRRDLMVGHVLVRLLLLEAASLAVHPHLDLADAVRMGCLSRASRARWV